MSVHYYLFRNSLVISATLPVISFWNLSTIDDPLVFEFINLSISYFYGMAQCWWSVIWI